jgi:hypothetical protein
VAVAPVVTELVGLLLVWQVLLVKASWLVLLLLVRHQVLKLLRWALVVWVLLKLLPLLVVVCLLLVRLQMPLVVVVRLKYHSVKQVWSLEALSVEYSALVVLSSEVLLAVSLAAQSLVLVELI